MDIEKIRVLIRMMVDNELTEISLRDGEEEVQLRRPSAHAPVPVVGPVAGLPQPVGLVEGGAGMPAGAVVAPAAEPEPLEDVLEIRSPMVGTFYTAPSPEAPPFVQVGSEVQPESPVCIVEAMKVFNEIKAEISGIITKILVDNQQAVEFGQPLFQVRPA